MSEIIYMRYWTPNGYIVRIDKGGVQSQWIAGTNDFSHDDPANSFYHQHIAGLKFKSKPEAQADLNEIAKRLGLQEAGTEEPYTKYIAEGE